MSSYPDYSNDNFNDILNKYEFSINKPENKKSFLYQEPHQILVRNFISKPTVYENILLYHQLGTGKCHAINTPILMHDGTIKLVQDIQIGDSLMGDDSTPRTVLSLARGTDKLYDIIPIKGESYTVNEEHILCLHVSGYPRVLTTPKSYIVQWVENNAFCSLVFSSSDQAFSYQQSITEPQIIEITVRDYLQLSPSKKALLKGYKVPVSFPESSVPLNPYLVGMWFANKKLSETQHLSESELELLKSYTRIPHIFKCNSLSNRLSLIAGLLDTSSRYIHGCFEILKPQTDSDICEDIIYISRSIGFACYKHNVTFNDKPHYRIIISGDGLDTLPLKSNIKPATRKQIKNPLVTGISVVFNRVDNYYGFTLNGNCRYLLGDFTVTHNTCSSISIAEGFKEYVYNMDKKIVVLIKNKNIQKNFLNELISKCTDGEYVDDTNRDLYFGVNLPKNQELQNTKKELVNKIHRQINKTYQFLTYGTFVNRVLGAKEFEKDEMGRNTTKIKRVNGEIQRKRAKNAIKNFNNTVIIVDEAHNVTNNDVYIALYQVLSRSYNYRLILLTATPMYDNPKEIFEISNLLNINSPSLQLPIRNQLLKNDSIVTRSQSPLINNKVLKGGIITLTENGLEQLKKSLYGKISFIKANTDTNPKKIEIGDDLIPNRIGTTKIVYCEMSKYQYIVYLEALKLDIKSDSKFDISSAIQNLEASENINEIATISKSSSLYKNSSDASTMCYPNKLFGKQGFLSVFTKSNGGYSLNDKTILTTNLSEYSSKLFNLLENIQTSPGNIFIYSNYVSYGGTSLLKQLLLYNGYKEYKSRSSMEYKSFVVFDESTNLETREKYRRIFNSIQNKDGKLIKIIIGSPIISEGITLKNVRQVHILEPSWNMSRINQIIGRAVRNYSHHALEPSDRNVEIFKYVSIYTPSKTLTNSTLYQFFIDKEKYILAEEKDRSNKKVERLLKQISFDCEINKSRNLITSELDGSPECDYTSCNFECDIKTVDIENTQIPVDKSTYNLNIQTFDKFDIMYILTILRELFKKYFIWHIDDIISHFATLEPHVSKESIYATLGHVIDNKILFTDMYNRDGFIINKNGYYIFNSTDIDINSSFYSKILDFSVDKNKYTLNEFVENKFNTNIVEPSDSKDKKTKQKTQVETVSLSDDDIAFNNHIIQHNNIFGTYRQRGTKDYPFGPIDGKFRIVDSRSLTSTDDDKRKVISGMWIGSYKKPQLIDIATYLNIDFTKYYKQSSVSIEDLDKEQLGKLLEKYLNDENLVLK
jgi:superfamily II DNA or RNA helicase